MSEISIHIYSNSYKERVAKLVLAIQRNEFSIPISLDDQPDLKQIDKTYQTRNGNFWIAMVDGNIAGTIGLIDIGNDQAALRKMFVDADYRGKQLGVGKKLLDTLLKWAQEHNFKEIFLGTTEKFIAAQIFYTKNGFEEIGKELLPSAFPTMEVDVKFYKVSFNG